MAPRPLAAPERVSPALDDVNDSFHEHYDSARDSAKNDAPVFVVCGDVLTVLRGDARRDSTFSKRIFHVMKAVAHAPVALFAAIHGGRGEARRLEGLIERVRGCIEELEAEQAIDEPLLDVLRRVLSSTLTFGTAAQTTSPTATALTRFATEQGPLLLQITEAATRVQLAALDACVEEALGHLTAAERTGLQVVVTGDHQARSRSLAMQYFQKRMADEGGAEERVTYGEGIDDAVAAHELVGTRRLDNAIATAFFGDSKRLQQDVLGDAAHALLAESKLSRIV